MKFATNLLGLTGRKAQILLNGGSISPCYSFFITWFKLKVNHFEKKRNFLQWTNSKFNSRVQRLGKLQSHLSYIQFVEARKMAMVGGKVSPTFRTYQISPTFSTYLCIWRSRKQGRYKNKEFCVYGFAEKIALTFGWKEN